MKNRTAKFLVLSIVCVFSLCVVVFSLMTYIMNKRSAEAIGELGALYMADMSKQAATHFGTAMELRVSQVSALTDAVPPSGNQSPAQARVALRNIARLRGFDHLALCGQDGSFEMLYGAQMQAEDPAAFLGSVERGEENMSAGIDEFGNRLVLMAIPAAYPMEGEKQSLALVAALPITYISETLSLDADKEMIYYCIIDREGDFIIRDSSITEENYFQRVYDRYDSVNGMSGEQYLAELRGAMQSKQNYTSQFTIEGERRYLYFTCLPFSDWYLLLFMPYGQLDQTVNALGNSWVWAAVLSGVAILLALAVVFAIYLWMTGKQMRELEEAKRLAEYASKAKSEFLSNMSHDIRTPMNGIVGMTAIASANLDNRQQVQSCLKKIDLSSRHLLGLINDILDMSKIESGKLELHMENISLPDTIRSVINIVQPQATAKNQSLYVYVRDVPCEQIVCDSVRFSQILLNLLGNAVKFTPDGGTIVLSCNEELSPKGEDYIRLLISVKDTGIGMTEEFQKKIFDAFAREDSERVQKTEGTGLGMAITKYIVDALHGSIDVTSKLNAGTEFIITLDCERATENEMRLPEWDVLVAEGDERTREDAALALRSLGCRAECVADGEAAISALKARPEGYPIILIDRELGGMGDLSLVRRVGEVCGKGSVLLLLTAADRNSAEQAAKEAGVAGAIHKPIFRSDLYHSLKPFTGEDGSAAAVGGAHSYDFTGRRILLAEDNDLNREIAQELLSEVGFAIDVAENGKICVEKFEAAPAGSYDAILMDIRMPILSGYQATAAIRSSAHPDGATVPIIAMSADAFSDDVKRCLESGMNAHIAKPIDMGVVSRVLSQFLNGKGHNNDEK